MKLSNYDLKVIGFLLLITFSGFIINNYYSLEIDSCIQRNNSFIKKIYIYTVLILHHLVFSLLYFGWLFNNKTLLIIFLFSPVVIMLHWLTNNWKCKLSQMINNVCKFDDFKLFEDFFDIIGLKKNNISANFFRGFFVLFGIIVAYSKLKKI